MAEIKFTIKIEKDFITGLYRVGATTKRKVLTSVVHGDLVFQNDKTAIRDPLYFNPELLNEEGKMSEDVLEHLPLYIADYLRQVLAEVVVTDPDYEDVARGSLEAFSVSIKPNWKDDITEK